VNRYRTYITRDIGPVIGSLPMTAVTETTIARWVQQLGGSGKTIANKHGFLSGAFNAAVKPVCWPRTRARVDGCSTRASMTWCFSRR
jgi:hypothetical protein